MVLFVTRLCEIDVARRPRRPRRPQRGTPPPSSSLSSTWLLCESRLLASFGGSVTRTGGGCVVWVLSYTKQGCLRLFEAGLRKLRLLASFGGTCMRTGGVASFGALVTRNEAASVVWRLVYMRGGCWRRWGLGYATYISLRTSWVSPRISIPPTPTGNPSTMINGSLHPSLEGRGSSCCWH